MDLKKEIKLSDLFRRKPKDSAEPEVSAPPEEKPKKERSFFTLRRKKDDTDGAAPAEAEAKPPKEPKERRRRKEKAKAVPPLPAVPIMRAFNLLPREEGRRETVTTEEDGRRPSPVQRGLARAIQGLIGVTVRVGDPLVAVEAGKKARDASNPALAVPIGLGMAVE